MKNIAIIVPTLNKGGAERVAANMSIEFAKHYNVYVIVHDGRDIIYPYDGTLIDLKLPPSGTKLGKITTLIKRIHAIRKIKKKYNIHATISHLPPSNYANIFSHCGDRIFTYVHNMEKWTKGTALREFITAKLSHHVVCVSECVRRNMIDNFHISPKKAMTMYNFCDMDTPKAEKHSEGISIVNMGRLSEQKGQWHLIRAMRKVVDSLGNSVKLTIVGDGEKRESLKALAESLGISENIHFTGFLDDPWSELSKADIYVSSSLWEGLPMALVEAGRCGLPIISTDCDAGCREILAPETDIHKKTDTVEMASYGILVPVCLSGDETQIDLTHEETIMADAILSLAKNIELRLSYAELAKERSEYFRSNNIMKQWIEILE